MRVVAVSIPGALAAIGVAVFGFAVVIAVSFVVLRLISFVTSGQDEDEASVETVPQENDPPAPAE